MTNGEIIEKKGYETVAAYLLEERTENNVALLNKILGVLVTIPQRYTEDIDDLFYTLVIYNNKPLSDFYEFIQKFKGFSDDGKNKAIALFSVFDGDYIKKLYNYNLYSGTNETELEYFLEAKIFKAEISFDDIVKCIDFSKLAEVLEHNEQVFLTPKGILARE